MKKMRRGVIIYLDQKRQVDKTHLLLLDLGYKVGRYHSDRPDAENLQVIEDYLDGTIDIVVATSGFGRGLNLTVDFVVVAHTPSNLSTLAQYFGRAGRDGRPAHCFWLTTNADKWFLRHVEDKIWESRLDDEAQEHLIADIKRIQSAARRSDTMCLRKILLKPQGQLTTIRDDPRMCCGTCSKRFHRTQSSVAA